MEGTPDRSVAEERLRTAITDGDLAPGARLVEADLVELFGVSRGTVRLAIDALVAEGLVERIPNRGARVRVVTTEEAVAITEARMALESLIARKAAQRATDDDVDRLRAQVELMRGAVGAGDLLKYSALISQLHGQIRDLADQPVAKGLVDRLQAQLVRHQFRLSLRPGRPQVSLRGLTAIVDAIADRDPDRAEAAAAQHFRGVIAALSEPNPGGPA
ncbi:GntR family transcriptional regulator [Petropleomorpha daqingensis]|uniref:DNA-binding GntR family transcriptional regulator n=1 Tax=Petropleomorpha daqingensis TaxID=2026353 RepID=A0A853CJF4_9ACTN|nr:GntR family transcriptional regulator [Petropleomorpha daqingensis]NYJ07311.1 DNA-binding GntR family transcriptional regulator [Petropleomorpha daqingensis]